MANYKLLTDKLDGLPSDSEANVVHSQLEAGKHITSGYQERHVLPIEHDYLRRPAPFFAINVSSQDHSMND